MKKVAVLFLLLLSIFSSCEISGDPELLELMLEIKNQNNEMREELKSLQSKTDSLLNAIKDIEESNLVITEKLNQVTSDLGAVLEELNNLNAEIQKGNSDLDELKAQLVMLNEKYEALLSELESLQLLQQLLVEMEQLKNQISELEDKSDLLLSSIDETNSSLEQLKSNIDQVRSDLEKVLAEISKLTLSLSETDADIDTILEELTNLQNQCKDLTELLNQLLNAPKVGDFYQGGYVFYLDESSLSGLVVAAVNQRDFGTEWGCYCEDIQNTKSEVGSGKENTQQILNQCETSQNIPNWAARIVDDLNLEGFSDWYLPSKDELDLIYTELHLNEIGEFSTEIPYWTSTQTDYGSCGIAGGAWVKNFGTGQNIKEAKNGFQENGAVRAIRSF